MTVAMPPENAESVDDWAAKVMEYCRSQCCRDWPKPCAYHEGMADAFDAVNAWIERQGLAVFPRGAANG